MHKFILFLLFSSLVHGAFSQTQYQYFDGNDTIEQYTLDFQFSAIPEDIWSVVEPNNVIFNQAYSAPKALLTAPNGPYPTNNNSSFMVTTSSEFFGPGILAIQWVQKLNYQPGTDSAPGDGGYIEYSLDSGSTWSNVVTSPYVYNFYGFNENNLVELSNGEMGFSGTDNEWRDIWLCFETYFLDQFGDIYFRFKHVSDGISSAHEGWMMDNFQAHITFFHTIAEKEENNYLQIAPNPSTGTVNIKAAKHDDYHIIESMQLLNIDGKVVEEYGLSPTKFRIDIGHHPKGTYFLKVQTNLKTEIHKILLTD